MSKRIYPVTVENGELVESNEKLTVNGLPIAKDGTIDSSYVSGGSSEWTVDANGNLVPKDGEPVQVGSLRSDEVFITNVGVTAYLSANQTISANTTTKVGLDATEYDHEAEFDTTNSKFVADDAGTYAVGAQLRYGSPGSDGGGVIYIYKNGVAHAFATSLLSSTLRTRTLSIHRELELVAGDTIEVYTKQYTGAGLDIQSGADRSYVSISQQG